MANPRLSVELNGEFRQRVYEIVRLVPYGQVTTYGFVATLCGMPRHARQVGWALHSLPNELVWDAESDVRRKARRTPRRVTSGEREPRAIDAQRVPWHRVINAKGQVSTHPDEYGTRRQIDLLRDEGIDVTDDGILVDGLAAHQWQPDPAAVDHLELPAEVLYAIDRQLEA